MKPRRYRIIPKSALGTPLKSDTVAGQLLCIYRERHGEEALEKLIERFKAGEPPFILSDAFPAETIPTPLLPPIPRQRFKRLAESEFEGDDFEALQTWRSFNKLFNFIPLREWLELRENLSMEKLFLHYCANYKRREKKEAHKKTVLEQRNIIDRNSGRTLETGGLFSVEATWHSGELYLLAKVSDDFLDELDELMKYLGELGFGCDRSLGKGHLEIKRDDLEPEEAKLLKTCPSANCHLNLSTYSSSNGADLKGFYNIKTKFGKVWNGFGTLNPFKHPLLVFEPGSVFFKPPENLSDTVIKEIHPQTKIIQVNIPLMIPFVFIAHSSNE